MERKEAFPFSNGAELDTAATTGWVLTTQFGEETSREVVVRDQAGILGSRPVEYESQRFASPKVGSKLNPFAEEWDPINNKAPEEDRCCFLTFSNGFPLTERQIINFFTRKYGPSCVEKVYIHRPEARFTSEQPPLFGKVVFHSLVMPAIVLGGEAQVKFEIDRKPLWCKKFDKDKLRRPMTN